MKLSFMFTGKLKKNWGLVENDVKRNKSNYKKTTKILYGRSTHT